MKKYNFTGIEAIFDYKQPGFLSPYRRSVYLVLVAIMLGISCMEAQVTIGGDKAPTAGLLLSLNSDTKGGLQFSNVSLSTNLTVIPDSFPGMSGLSGTALDAAKEDFKGAMVYNINPLAGRGIGIYAWNGGNWDFVGNTRHFEVPDYANGTEVITGTGEGTWLADKSGFVVCKWGTGASGDTGVRIDTVKVISSDYTETGYGSVQKAMVPIAVGQELTVKSPVGSDVGAKFYPTSFAEKQADNGYSFNEVKTNDIWVDSKPIYKKTVFRQNFTFATSYPTDHEIIVADVFPSLTYVDKVLKIEGSGYLPSENNNPIVFIGSWVYDIKKWTLGAYYTKLSNNITIEKGGNTAITINDFTITLYYTKVSD